MNNEYAIAAIDRLRIKSDGEGIRTLVVTSGCPLHCRYCINPFTWNGSEKTTWMTAEEIYGRVSIDRIYLLSTNGGVTFGGGEPFLQPGLIHEFAEINREGYSINVETSLNVPWENIEEIVDVIDTFIVDIKSMDAKIYTEYTGGCFDTLYKNLEQLINKVDKIKILVRIPMIRGYVDQKQQEQSKEKLEKMGVTQFDLFEYSNVD